MMDQDVAFRRYDAQEAAQIVETLVGVQQEVYADAEPREFFSEDRYRRQLAGHMGAPGWQLVAAHSAGDVVGYAYGFSLQPGTAWWNGMLSDVPEEATRETGSRTFALSELMVRAQWRGRGIGRALHDGLLAGRPEERATLLVEPDNTAAKALYARWGWAEVGRLRPSWESAPVLEALLLPLPATERGHA